MKTYEQENALWGEFKVYDVVNKRLAATVNDKIWTSNIRKFGHSVANRLYKSITGNESIFNTKIVFISDRTSRKDDSRKEVYIMDFDGEKKQRITFKNSLILSPAISPDNKSLLFTSIESRWQKSKDGRPRKVQNLNLYLYDLVTRKQKVISSTEGINSGAIFSADGQDIYLTLSNLKNADIYKMNLKTGKKQRELYNKRFGHTDWVTTCAYVSDGRILSGSMDKRLCLWDRSAVRSNDLMGHNGSISKVKVDN